MSKYEIIRRLRIGDLKKVLRDRYRHTVPDDDAGQEDLFELLLPVSLGAEPARKMKNIIQTWARWMSPDETAELIDRINLMPIYERKVGARMLGERMRIPNELRERLKLKTIKPFDMTDEQLREQRRAKDRAGRQRRRRAAGSKPRGAYLAGIRQKKDWEKQGISRRTWYRHRQKRNGTGPSSVKLTNSRRHTCATEQGERPEGLAKGNGEDRKTVSIRKTESTARGFAS